MSTATEAPGWWALWTSETESTGIRDALLELAGPDPQTFGELAAGVREQWGPATSAQIRAALLTLVRCRRLCCASDGYVRCDGADEDGEE